MIRALRRRFIAGALAAFGILLMLLVGGFAVVGYVQVEQEAQSFLEFVMNDGDLRGNKQRDMRNFDMRLGRGGGHYLIEVDADGEMRVEVRGIWEADLDAARELGERILEKGGESGRLGDYRYLTRVNADGSMRIVVMDNAMQTRMLSTLVFTAALVGLACMAALFLILLPVSARVVRSYAANIERQKQFITNAGHEVKTPVAIIMSNVDALELIQGESKWSRNIRGQTQRLSALLQKMLFMARVDEHSLTPPSEKLRLDALVSAELEPYREPMEERNIRFSCEIGENLNLRGSREYLQQLVHILLDNAAQYADEGGEIFLKLEKKRQKARLILENTVEKLPDCPPEALFDRFFRGDSARTQAGGGYGIGLSAARAIAEMHRGRIEAEYLGEKKIRFTVELPA